MHTRSQLATISAIAMLTAGVCCGVCVSSLPACAAQSAQVDPVQAQPVQAQPVQAKPVPAEPAAQPLDRVIAVVNNQVILASDLELEMRVFRLLPLGGGRDDLTPAKALERLTTRALIEQQILLQDPRGLEVDPKDVAENLIDLRRNLPNCKRHDCTSAAGWVAYLATLGLSPDRINEYWAHRMAVLRFIERRFRSGIRISPEEIKKYYHDSFLPQYPSAADAPPLEQVSTRIQEVLLQQQVNSLLNDWLKSLQQQGQVEILDPALASASAANADSEAKGGGA
jgi:peptidyl-prolyl cis-trans isomerase SurA